VFVSVFTFASGCRRSVDRRTRGGLSPAGLPPPALWWMSKVLVLESEMLYLKISASVAGVGVEVRDGREVLRGGRGGGGRSPGGSGGETKGRREGRQGA